MGSELDLDVDAVIRLAQKLHQLGVEFAQGVPDDEVSERARFRDPRATGNDRTGHILTENYLNDADSSSIFSNRENLGKSIQQLADNVVTTAVDTEEVDRREAERQNREAQYKKLV